MNNLLINKNGNRENLDELTLRVVLDIQEMMQNLESGNQETIYEQITTDISNTPITDIKIKLRYSVEDTKEDEGLMRHLVGVLAQSAVTKDEFLNTINAGTLFNIPLREAQPNFLPDKNYFYKGIDFSQFVGEQIGKALFTEPLSHFSTDYGVGMRYATGVHSEKEIGLVLEINKVALGNMRRIHDTLNLEPDLENSKNLHLYHQIIPPESIETIYYFIK